MLTTLRVAVHVHKTYRTARGVLHCICNFWRTFSGISGCHECLRVVDHTFYVRGNGEVGENFVSFVLYNRGSTSLPQRLF